MLREIAFNAGVEKVSHSVVSSKAGKKAANRQESVLKMCWQEAKRKKAEK